MISHLRNFTFILVFSFSAQIFATGYDVGPDFDWLQIVNKPENEQTKLMALKYLSEVPDQEYKELIREQFEKPRTYTRQEKHSFVDEKALGCTTEEINLYGKNPLDESDDQWQVTLKSYKSLFWDWASDRNRMNIVIVPPTGGLNPTDSLYAQFFCRLHPMNVLIIEQWSGDDRNRPSDVIRALQQTTAEEIDPKTHDRHAIKAMAAIRYAIQYFDLNKRSNGESYPVGLLGNSLGAIYGVGALALIDQIQAGVLIVGGVNSPEIVATSFEKKMQLLRGVRKGLMKEMYGPRPPEYLAKIKENLFMDPKSYLPQIIEKQKPVYLITAERDETVPTIFQNQLVEGLQEINPIHEYFEYDPDSTITDPHVRAVILSSLWRKTEFSNFFKENLH